MPNIHEIEFKEFKAALAEMHEGELARLVDIVETLVKELQIISLHNSESAAALITAHRYLKLWNDEVQHVLKLKHQSDAAKLE